MHGFVRYEVRESRNNLIRLRIKLQTIYVFVIASSNSHDVCTDICSTLQNLHLSSENFKLTLLESSANPVASDSFSLVWLLYRF